MNLKKINLVLSVEDLKRLLRITLDDDAEEALKFLKQNLL